MGREVPTANISSLESTQTQAEPGAAGDERRESPPSFHKSSSLAAEQPPDRPLTFSLADKLSILLKN